MPTCQQVAQLLNAQRAGDHRTVNAMLEAIATEQRERGQGRGAEIINRVRLEMQRRPSTTPDSIRERLERAMGGGQPHPMSNPEDLDEEVADPNAIPEEIASLLMRDENPHKLEEIYLHKPVRDAVDAFLLEYKEQDKLIEAGLSARNRIIMAGPPGNGKTVLASAIADKLGLDMYKTDFSQIISAYMGIGPRNIGNIFRFIKERPQPVALFMDEADAIITSREMLSGQAAGACAQEYRVMVNTILTGLDELGSKSVVFAASNFERNLDAAALRRFNMRLWLKPPAMDGITKYISDYERNHTISFSATIETFNGLVGQPWSKIEEFCQEQHRSIVLGQPCSLQTGWIGR